MTLTLNLTQEPETVTWPETHYVFVERIGNIPDNAQKVWKTAEDFAPAIGAHNQITGAAALYKPVQGIYRAGFLLAAAPVNLPTGLAYEKLNAGKYACFKLTGPFPQLPEANTRAFAIVAEKKIVLRDDFNIEHYITDPRTTPADENVTEILFPRA
jgi:predicted transcriptional regulator YdeE